MGGEKKWLVKSSDTIHGPFEFDRVVENIFTGEIHLLDEIKGPFERWRSIKDDSLFAAAIEKLKASTYQSRENTMTATIEVGTQTDKVTSSQTLSINNTDSHSVTPIAQSVAASQVPTAETPINQYFEAPPAQANPNYQNIGVGVPTQKSFPTVFIFSFLLIIAAGLGYLIYEFKQTRLIEQKISAYDQLTDNAIDSLRVGEYQKSLKNFTLAYNISPKDPNLLVEMLPLSIQFGGQFNQAQISLETMLATRRPKTVTKLARNIIGLSYSYRQQYGSALASYDAALTIDDQFLPAMLNKAYVLLKLKKFKESRDLMRTVVAEHPDEPIVHYFYIRSLLELGLVKKNEFLIKEMLSVADQFPQRFTDFKQEVLFLIAVAHWQLKTKKEDLQKKIKRFLQVDMELTNLHVHNTLIDFQSFNWLDYIPHCKAMAALGEDYDKQMLEAFCLLKVNRTVDAKAILDKLLAQRSDDGLLQALYASALLKLNDISQAKNAMGFLNQVDQKQSVVETILRGCLAVGDLNCGEAIFRGRHAKHISLLYSHWGNSEVLLRKNRRKAKTSIVLGLQIAPNFAPLLKLKRQL